MHTVEAFPATELGNASFLIADPDRGVGLVVDPYRNVDDYLTRSLDDGSGNPPRGWGNPYDNGTMTLIDKSTAVFTDPAGHRAVFSTQPKDGIPTIEMCS
jgi:hypothetical protein